MFVYILNVVDGRNGGHTDSYLYSIDNLNIFADECQP